MTKLELLAAAHAIMTEHQSCYIEGVGYNEGCELGAELMHLIRQYYAELE